MLRFYRPKKSDPPNCPIIDTSAPADSASMNAFVPDRAIVPRLLTRSALVMPTPESRIVSVPAALSGMRRMKSSGSDSSRLLSVSASWRILSSASDALEMSSRMATSLLE